MIIVDYHGHPAEYTGKYRVFRMQEVYELRLLEGRDKGVLVFTHMSPSEAEEAARKRRDGGPCGAAK